MLAPASALAQRAARLPWWDRAASGAAGHYWIKTDLPEDEARALAIHLNRMHERYSEFLESVPPRTPEKLNVLMFALRDDYQFTLRARFRLDPTGTGGIFFDNPTTGGGLAFWTESLPQRRVEHVIQHEGFHQFAWSRFGGDLPIWANEGLAEFFGNAVIVGDEMVIGQSQPRVVKALQDAVENETYIPFRTLLDMTPREWNDAVRSGRARLQYRQAWSMVDFLVYGDDGRYARAFDEYLVLLNKGFRSREAFYRAFGVDDDRDIEDFENRWKTHVLAMKPRAFITALERIEFLAAGALELNRRGVHPTSLESLREALQEIGFRHTLAGHGLDVTLDAAEADLFLIPADDLNGGAETPRFVVSPHKPRRSSRRLRELEELRPTPAAIRTEHLRPHGLVVRWTRDAEDPERFTYEIDVRDSRISGTATGFRGGNR